MERGRTDEAIISSAVDLEQILYENIQPISARDYLQKQGQQTVYLGYLGEFQSLSYSCL